MNNLIGLDIFSTNDYWGRGILIGNSGNKTVAAYFIMGRSENSRNRYFYRENKNIAISPYDTDKILDPSLIIYYPVKTIGSKLIVTNGDQTDTIAKAVSSGKTFEEGLRMRSFEPDKPHFTPRISGIADLDAGDFKLSILKNIDGEGNACGRYFFEYPNIDGEGRFIHTYMGNNEPLPTFEGEPLRIAVTDDIDELTDEIWARLDDENKISLAVLMVDRNELDEQEKKIGVKRRGSKNTWKTKSDIIVPGTSACDLRIKNKRMGE